MTIPRTVSVTSISRSITLQSGSAGTTRHIKKEITLPVRVLHAVGVATLVLTNAAGGVNLAFEPGDLMLISDHINYSGANPLIGKNLEQFGPRFPDASDIYTGSLRAAVREKAAAVGIPLREGVYMMFSGPNYETPAEIRMARILGADAVGMSTVSLVRMRWACPPCRRRLSRHTAG